MIQFQRPVTFGEAAFYPYKINQSVRYNDDDSAYLHWTPGSHADDNKKWSFSTQIKRCNIGTIQVLLAAGSDINNRTLIYFEDDMLKFYSVVASDHKAQVLTDMLFRDVGSWYHILVVLDASNNKVTFYINGVEVDQTVNIAVVNIDTYINYITYQNTIARSSYDASYYGDYYLAETHMVDGQALTPDDFGKFKNGIWIPKRYTGSYGTNGFKLDFTDENDLGNDVSGNNNDFTSSGLASNDKVLDSPTNNYPTLNTIANLNNISNGNLDLDTTNYEYYITAATKAIPLTGKWYWEVTDKGGVNLMPGIINIFYNFRADDRIAENAVAYGYSYYRQDGDLYYGAGSSKAFGATYTTNDIIGIAVNMDAEEITFYKNNVLQGTEPITISVAYPQYVAAAGDASGSVDTQCSFNFGQLGFTYTPPTGYKALCSKNIRELQKPSKSYDVYSDCGTEDDYSSGTYTGNGNVDGPFIYLGYYPTDVCIDGDHYDETSSVIDVLSNGFKLRSLTKNTNTTSYTWEAWVYQDGKYSNAALNVV